MNSNNILVTGSSGLIGSEVVSFFVKLVLKSYGIDNNMRKKFFGDNGSTLSNLNRLENKYDNFLNYEIDIRDRSKISELIQEIKPFV